MEHELVNFETAKLAKEKGFDIITGVSFTKEGVSYNENPSTYDYINRPTQSLLQKWLRDIHNIHIIVEPKNKWEYKLYIKQYIKADMKLAGFSDTTYFKTYEQALEIGLQEALKLI